MSDKGWLEGGEHPTLPFSDRQTSKEAAESMIGSASSLRRLVYDVIKHLGGCTDDEIEVGIQVNGKLRDTIMLPRDCENADAEALAAAGT